MLATGVGFLLLGGVAGSDSSITVTQGDFELTCPAGTVAEGATLACTLKNTASEARPWPVVAILHLSTDADRALVRGTSIDVTLGAPSPEAAIDGGVTWIGDTLVGYSRFDWSGNAGADPTKTTTTVAAPGNTRSVNIVAEHDSLDEDSEKFYVALGPDGSKGVGILYNNRTSVTLTDADSPSTDTSLSSLELFAGQSYALSPRQVAPSQTVAYEVTEATLTAVAAGGATMTMSASFDANFLDLDGRGGIDIEVISGQESAAVPLAVGATIVALTVTAEDGTTTDTRWVSIVRSALGYSVDTVAVSVPSFTLTCPAEVAKATDTECTLRASGSAGWPVVAVIHSSADGAARALVAEDPITPDTDPGYSKDLSLGEQQPARTAFNRGYGELFSGGSLTLYRTYGYEKFDWSGIASAGAERTVTIHLHDNVANSGGAAEVFYVALAPSGYTGLSQLVDNMVPVLLKELPAARSVAAQNIKSASAEIAVQARNAAGTLYLRYRAGTSGAWTETAAPVTSSPARVSITGLTPETEYEVQASFDEDFSTGVRSGSFTTLSGPSVSGVEVVSYAGEDDTYAMSEVLRIRVTFSEAVDVTGAPTLGIDMDPADGGRTDAVYSGGSGTTQLTFAYTVIEPDYSSQGIAVIADTLELNGGAITAVVGGADAGLAHTGLGHDADHKVDWQQPPNRSPVFRGTNQAMDSAYPGYLLTLRVSKDDFHDPDGDSLTFALSASRDDVHVPGGFGYIEQHGRIWFQAKTACALAGLAPPTGDAYYTVITLTATDPDGATAQAAATFRTNPTEFACPSLSSAAVDGDTLTITLAADGLLPLSFSQPAAEEFVVKADGTAVSLAATGAVSADDTEIVLRLASPVTASQIVTVSYTPGDDAMAAAFTEQAVTNNTPAPEVEPFWLLCAPAQPYDAANQRWTLVEPPLGSTGNAYVPGSLVAGQCSVLDAEGAAPAYWLAGADADMFDISVEGVLSFAVAPDFEAPADSDGDNVYEVTVTAVSGYAVSLDLAVAVIDAPEAQVIVIPLQDGSDCTPHPDGSMIPICAKVSGGELTLTFNRDLAAVDDDTAGRLPYAFFVDGAFYQGAPISQSPNRVVVDGATVTLSLGTAVLPGDNVTVTYRAGAGSRIQQADGTPLPDFTVTLPAIQRD